VFKGTKELVMSKSKWLVLAAAAGLLLGACNGDEGQKKGGVKMAPKASNISEETLSRCRTEGKRVVKLDLNKDQQPDVWKLYATKTEGGAKVDLLTCKEVDLNYDGRKDLYVYYDDSGNRAMEEMDLDFDGRVDIVTFRRAGKIIRQELDTNFDGKPDIWKHYEEEVLVRVDRDTSGNGRVDFWEYYEGGQLDRVGYDKDGDGKVDAWDRAPARETASAAPPAPTPPTEGGTDKGTEKAPPKKDK
jgi:hypothetical protein